MNKSGKVTLFEVGPRDGLQNEKVQISTKDKIKLVDLLSNCGFKKIEVTSFVSPKWVPQLSDAAEVMNGILRKSDIDYAVLTPNMRGYEGARSANADEIAVFAAASETFSQKNINCTIAESIERFKPVIAAAADDEVPVRGYISCVTDCPYEGAVDPDMVSDVANELFKAGCYEISLGDTIGHATPESTTSMLKAVLEVIPADNLAGHFHDTRGRALENIVVSLELGLRTFDAAVGGLGGCPYAPGAKGNVDTSKVAQLLEEKGFETGISMSSLKKAEEHALSLVSRECA